MEMRGGVLIITILLLLDYPLAVDSDKRFPMCYFFLHHRFVFSIHLL